MTPLLSVLLLGFFLGMRHATDPDHVIAVTTIVSRQRSVRAAAWTGALWGLGHTLTILAVGGAIILFGILFLWQLPHFLAIAWMYRDDYARAGLPMLPVIEPDGRSTGRQAALYAAALLPVALAPSLVGMSGPAYFTGALVLTLLFLGMSLRFAMTRAVRDARRLFFASIIYLPLLWGLMIVDRT